MSRGGGLAATVISWLMVEHSAGAPSRTSLACHTPAAGVATSANQKYGGPPWRSCVVAATVPSGAISENSPCSGFSAAKMTRSGAPFHGASGDGSTPSWAASSQLEPGACACEFCPERTTSAPATSNDAAQATVNPRVIMY